MKKNKTLAYMLAATLLVGGTFVGTKALFTDVEQVAGELKISTGDVDIKVTSDTNWELVRNGEEDNKGTNNEEGSETIFDNLKPGDVLTKTITVQNQGTLVAELNLVRNKDVGFGVLDGFLTSEETFITDSEGNEIIIDQDELTLEPNKTAKLQLKIKADGKGKHEKTSTIVDGVKNYNADDIEDKIETVTNAWTLHATQQNPKEMPNN